MSFGPFVNHAASFSGSSVSVSLGAGGTSPSGAYIGVVVACCAGGNMGLTPTPSIVSSGGSAWISIFGPDYLGDGYALQNLLAHANRTTVVQAWICTTLTATDVGGTATVSCTGLVAGDAQMTIASEVTFITLAPAGASQAQANTVNDGNTGVSINPPQLSIPWSDGLGDVSFGGIYHTLLVTAISKWNYAPASGYTAPCSISTVAGQPASSGLVAIGSGATGFGVVAIVGLRADSSIGMNEVPGVSKDATLGHMLALAYPLNKVSQVPDLQKVPGASASDHGNPLFGIGTIGGGVEIL